MNKLSKILLAVSIVLLISLIISIRVCVYLSESRERAVAEVMGLADKYSEMKKLEKEKKQVKENIKFVRTYKIVSSLGKQDQTGENTYYVIEQFQEGRPVVVKINNSYTLEENSNYEFSFEGQKAEGTEYTTIEEIFSNFELVNIEKTEKEGTDQRQDSISK